MILEIFAAQASHVSLQVIHQLGLISCHDFTHLSVERIHSEGVFAISDVLWEERGERGGQREEEGKEKEREREGKWTLRVFKK
jgi:hypothetical protein